MDETVLIIILIIYVVLMTFVSLVFFKIKTLKTPNNLNDINQLIKNIIYEKRIDEIKDLNQAKDEINSKLENNFDRFNKMIETRLTNNQSIINDKFNNLNDSQKAQLKDLSLFKDSLTKSLKEDFEKLNKVTEERLIGINKKVDASLKEGFEKTNESFTNMLERLVKIDEAQKKIESLSTEVVSLQNVLTDKKTRGIFGEVQLNQILESVFGDKKQMYNIQYSLSNNTKVDAIVHCPQPLGNVCIDSKFPLENYRKMVDKTLGEKDKEQATKLFKVDVKRHIDDIANKYIIENETSDQAMMFIPAEAIFAEINAYHLELIEYSQKKKVWLVSPTTLISTLTTIQVLVRNMERDKHAKILQEHITVLSKEFKNFVPRWSTLKSSVETLGKKVGEFDITTNKISKSFDKIVSADIEQLEETNFIE